MLVLMTWLYVLWPDQCYDVYKLTWHHLNYHTNRVDKALCYFTAVLTIVLMVILNARHQMKYAVTFTPHKSDRQPCQATANLWTHIWRHKLCHQLTCYMTSMRSNLWRNNLLYNIEKAMFICVIYTFVTICVWYFRRALTWRQTLSLRRLTQVFHLLHRGRNNTKNMSYNISNSKILITEWGNVKWD